MARKRVIDTTELFFDTKLVKLLGAKGVLLYVRLWCIAEDWGGYIPDYDDIALQMGALRFTPAEVKTYIEKLVADGKVVEYEQDGIKIHWIKSFMKHQTLKNPVPPSIPLPVWVRCEKKNYPSGRAYAKYKVDDKKIPNYHHVATIISEDVAEDVVEEKGDGRPKTKPLGEFKNVKLSWDDCAKLEGILGIDGSAEYVEKLSSYMASTGKSYKNHCATILGWYRKHEAEKPKRTTGGVSL